MASPPLHIASHTAIVMIKTSAALKFCIESELSFRQFWPVFAIGRKGVSFAYLGQEVQANEFRPTGEEALGPQFVDGPAVGHRCLFVSESNQPFRLGLSLIHI